MNSKSQDMTSLLAAWGYNEDNTVRRVQADDGREVLQVRLPLGMEQYEIHGRPDGKRPMKRESWLHFYWSKAGEARREGREFRLAKEDFSRLYQEGLLYYHRYVLFFQIREYQLCSRDTRRNSKLLEFVSRYAKAEDAEQMLQYRPYIHRMNVMARALDKLQEDDDIGAAVRILKKGIKEIEGLPPIKDNQVFENEQSRSLKSLEDLLGGLAPHAPLPRKFSLERELEKAIREENYEKAASIRDEIASLIKTRRGNKVASDD